MGSKASIAGRIIASLPSADSFVDLFGGGGAITHAAVLSGKYKNVYYNEIDPLVVDLFKRAINGDFNYDKFKPEFITRDRFFAEKDKDGYVSLVWSFGNNRRCYLCGKDIEGDKKSLHNAIIFDVLDDFAIKVLGFNKWPDNISTVFKRRMFSRSKAKSRRLLQLEQLIRLQRLQQLQRLEQLEPLNISCLDYKDFPLIGGDVIYYCDPPYKGTRGYLSQIDHDHFFNFAASLPYPCYISEYEIKDKRFYEAINLNKNQNMSPNGRAKKVERVYANKAGFEKYHKKGTLIP